MHGGLPHAVNVRSSLGKAIFRQLGQNAFSSGGSIFKARIEVGAPLTVGSGRP
jgi:hypothetical protein